MPFRIDQKLVVGVSTNALFNLEKEDQLFNEQDVEAYKQFQKENRKVGIYQYTKNMKLYIQASL